MNKAIQQNRISEGFARALAEIRERDYRKGDEELVIDQMSEIEPHLMKEAADLIVDLAGWNGAQIPTKTAAEFSMKATSFFLALSEAYANTAENHAHDMGYYEKDAA